MSGHVLLALNDTIRGAACRHTTARLSQWREGMDDGKNRDFIDQPVTKSDSQIDAGRSLQHLADR